jgi:glycerate-2-kinase
VLESLGALVRSGPTGTNVGDLQIVLLGPTPPDPER